MKIGNNKYAVSFLQIMHGLRQIDPPNLGKIRKISNDYICSSFYELNYDLLTKD
jgi:hypothetical protein